MFTQYEVKEGVNTKKECIKECKRGDIFMIADTRQKRQQEKKTQRHSGDGEKFEDIFQSA